MTPLERRYRLLLLSYPKRYRQERSEEITGTLLELARPGQRYPTPREVATLILAGLRTRARGADGPTSATLWPGALRLATLFLLADAAALTLAELLAHAIDAMLINGEPPAWRDGVGLLTLVLIGGALVACAASRRALTLPLIVLAALASYGFPQRMVDGGISWVLPLAALASLPLLRWRAPATRHPSRWLLTVPVALIVLPTQLPVLFTADSWVYTILFSNQFEILVALLIVCLLWSVVDARVPFAAGTVMLAFAVPALLALVTGGSGLYRSSLVRDAWVWGITAVVPLVVGSACAKRQARL